MNVKITIVYDNTTRSSDLVADWGFSCYIETLENQILFDTGTKPQILLSNMEKLNIDPNDADLIFVSHQHGDHMGGLFSVMDLNTHADVFVPIEIGHSIYKNKVRVLEDATQITDKIFSSGLLLCEGRRGLVEQSLYFGTNKGMIAVAGCSHSGVSQILKKCTEFGNPYALIGGLHGFNEFRLVDPLSIICPTHCTQHIKTIKKQFPKKYIQGGVGTIINL
ncbi:MAG: MBL fold metallo-hydrolase [Candidatus Lokiarchaeota archaeon]|nr:MBL fold metallo-hydrolase [Candidatus Lokiarchaeota archaeon]